MVLALLSCADESISGYADGQAVYTLRSIDDVDFEASATISFPSEGTVSGQGPCNQWSATQSAPYPWIDLGPIAATRRACPELQAEGRFFDALSQMTISEVSGDVLILSNDAGREMVFQAR